MRKTKRYIIDTSTLVSAWLIKNSIPFKALLKAREKGSVIFSEETFLEFEMVLFRKKFDRYFSKEERLLIIEQMADEAEIIKVKSEFKICRDPKDDKFLHLAVDAGAKVIISSDEDLQVLHPFRNIQILSPVDFLKNF